MSKEFEAMLHLFGSAAQGKEIVSPDPAEIEEILRISKKQSCLYTVACTLQKFGGFGLSEEKQTEWFSGLENAYMFNYLRFMFLSEPLKEFTRANIPYVCLKGYTVGMLYHDPFYRVSSDIDLKVDEKDEKKAISLLEKYGYTVTKYRSEFTHHDCLTHPQWGLLELHTKLFEDDVTNVWFASEFGKLVIDETPYPVTFQGQSFCMLTPQAQLLQLFFHLIKHFIEGGLSIRAMTDFALTAIHFSDSIDFEAFRRSVKNAGMETLYDTILGFLVQYCNFDRADLPSFGNVDPEYISYLYRDLESGGWIGQSKMNSRKAMMAFAGQKNQQLGGKEDLTIFDTGLKDKWRMLFPTRNHLAQNYPYVAKYPFLYPAAFLSRLGRYLFCGHKGRESQTEHLSAQKNDRDRIELFEKLGLLETDSESFDQNRKKNG